MCNIVILTNCDMRLCWVTFPGHTISGRTSQIPGIEFVSMMISSLDFTLNLSFALYYSWTSLDTLFQLGSRHARI